MSDQLLAQRLFVEVAGMTSFSRGAREMRLSQPTASRIIAEREQTLGIRLFLRTTLSLTLTEAARGTGELRKMLRIGASSSFAARALMPRLPAFVAKHLRLKLDLLINDRNQDLIADGIDVALRFGRLSGQVRTSSANTAMAAALAGLGIYCGIVPAFDSELCEGKLVRLLPEWEMNTTEVHALFPAQAPKPSAREFVDFLESGLRDPRNQT